VELIKFGEWCDGYRKAVDNLEEMKKIGAKRWPEKQI